MFLVCVFYFDAVEGREEVALCSILKILILSGIPLWFYASNLSASGKKRLQLGSLVPLPPVEGVVSTCSGSSCFVQLAGRKRALAEGEKICFILRKDGNKRGRGRENLV